MDCKWQVAALRLDTYIESMAQHSDYPKTRLFVEHSLAESSQVILGEDAAHYVRDVLRMKPANTLAIFNGSDGEWLAAIDEIRKKEVVIVCQSLLRPQILSPDVWLLAAPLKASKHEDVAVKATELGMSTFVPVFTQFSVAGKVNEARIARLLSEASEQCERMDVPKLKQAQKLLEILGEWPEDRVLFYADESGGGENIVQLPHTIVPAWALLVGPEGGFSTEELKLLKSLQFARGICLGPRILKADTASIAALACLMAHYGDWNAKPAFRSLG
jgi:16S rRNA (uracil1498-N3)-methyltransferase